eukprot:gnl/MRDRNA2_/MRDRNA2_62166_c0_seq1.p1 gnl/MRDRNA2_/MRDRNA2_62166_c0~~gnl/MRDRNA2_/MRDRNA2_62166_c0_seq1.p1  ORF type:complete len:477 (-),score=109.58 gnl/MRDRNA2_/MRDRNA2_62166_c0_seq1:4-1434(-)
MSIAQCCVVEHGQKSKLKLEQEVQSQINNSLTDWDKANAAFGPALNNLRASLTICVKDPAVADRKSILKSNLHEIGAEAEKCKQGEKMVAPENVETKHPSVSFKIRDSVVESAPSVSSCKQDVIWACVTADIPRFELAVKDGGRKIIESEDPKHGLRAIHYACAHGSVEIVRLLVGAEYNAQVKFARRDVKPPVWYAAEQGHVDILQFLADHHSVLEDDCLPKSWEEWDKALPEFASGADFSVDQVPQRPLPSRPDPLTGRYPANNSEQDFEKLRKGRLATRGHLQMHFRMLNAAKEAPEANGYASLQNIKEQEKELQESEEQDQALQDLGPTASTESKGGAKKGIGQKLTKKITAGAEKFNMLMSKATRSFTRSVSAFSVTEHNQTKPSLLRRLSSALVEAKEKTVKRVSFAKNSVRKKKSKSEDSPKRGSKKNSINKTRSSKNQDDVATTLTDVQLFQEGKDPQNFGLSKLEGG